MQFKYFTLSLVRPFSKYYCWTAGCQTDEELMRLLDKMFETLMECRVNLHSVLTKLKIKYLK